MTHIVIVADTWFTNGSVLVPNTGLEGRVSGTYQPVWDAWQRFVEPLVSNVSWLTCLHPGVANLRAVSGL